jgi:hypothetical protein
MGSDGVHWTHCDESVQKNWEMNCALVLGKDPMGQGAPVGLLQSPFSRMVTVRRCGS